MKATSLIRCYLSIAILLCFTLTAKAQTISGPTTVCIGQTTNYHSVLSSGSYVWSLNGLPAPGIIYGAGSTISINWTKGGYWQLDLHKNVGGVITYITSAYITVIPPPKPYVTTNFRVACQSFDTVKLGNTYDPFILSDSNNCIDVCDSNLVNYFAKGGSTGDHYSWDVVGGAIVNMTPDHKSISVIWHSLTHGGSLSLVDTNAAGCTTTLRFCMNIVSKPNASFTMNDRTLAYDTITVCQHSNVLFHDQSTVTSGSLITGWHWDFGDGSSSSLKNPIHKYDTSGTYHAELTVTNACGCTSKFKATITVTTGPAPRIECPTVVCQGDTVRYTTPDGCHSATYQWSCSSGGTPLSASNLDHFIVRWDTVNSDGYGTVSLSITGCVSVCEGTSVAKVPVVQTSPTLQGPTLLCTGTAYQFSIPLWPATRYSWGVVDNPTSVISGRHSNTVAVRFDAAGTYTLHVSYQNSLKLCGGDMKYTIIVQDPPRIIGPTEVCSGGFTYSLSTPGLTANWYLSKPGAPGTYDSSIASTTFITMLSGGTYVLAITPPAGVPPFCTPPPEIINVGYVPEVDEIKGKTEVCIGKPYQYKANNYMAGYSYKWAVTGGTTYATAGDSITVVWTSTTGTITAKRVMLDSPYCASGGISKTIHKKIIDTCHIIGGSTVCQNSYGYYDITVPPEPDTKFEWSLPNATVGNITAVYGSESRIFITWGTGFTTPDTVKLKCKARACDTTITFEKTIIIVSPTAISLTAIPDTICRNGGVVLFKGPTSPGPGTKYSWTFGDGTSKDSTSADTISHRYAPGSSEFIASVIVPTSTYVCPISGIAFQTVVRDNPKTSINTSNLLDYCTGASISTTFTASTHGTSGSYSWYKSGTGTPMGTGSTYTATSTGIYFLVYTDYYSCPDTSNSLEIAYRTCTGTGCVGVPGLTLSSNCNVITATGSGSGTSPTWTATGGTISTISPTSINISYPVPGYYKIIFTETFGSCTVDTILADTVALIPDFTIKRTCNNPSFALDVTDISSVLSGWTIDSVRWKLYERTSGTLTATSTGITASFTGSAGDLDSIVERIYVSKGGVTKSCSIAKNITLPLLLTPYFTPNAVGTCDGTAMTFEAFPGDRRWAAYTWKMGDDFNSNLVLFTKSYAFNPTKKIIFPGVNEYKDTLIVTDTAGCVYVAIGVLNIYQNTLVDTTFASNYIACPGGADTVELFIGAAHLPMYDIYWSNNLRGSYKDFVTVSGGYSVWLQDAVGCVDKSNVTYVTVLNPPDMSIRGRTSYCDGERVKLSNYHFPHYHYQWYRDTIPIDTSAIIRDHVSPGTYVYRVVAIDSLHSCAADTSAPDTVIVHPTPRKPYIDSVIALDCPTYRLKIKVADTLSYKYTYNWSNGTAGPSTTVDNGGAYRVWRTDTFGCVSYSDTLIPYSPESWLAWFPTGCFTFCDQSAPDTIFGPPAAFSYWQWLPTPGTTISGSGRVNPLSIGWTPVSKDYQLFLDNGLCSQKSDTMKMLGFVNCTIGCPGIFPNTVYIYCDSSQPGGYTTITPVNLNNPSMTDTIFATIGLRIGPAIPFNIAIPPGGAPYTLFFTTLTNPPPGTTLLTAIYNYPGALHACYDTLRVPIPYPCGWPLERRITNNPKNGSLPEMSKSPSGMVVYPNPANDMVSVNYVYGSSCNCDRRIVLYDILGKRLASNDVKDLTGTVSFPTNQLIPGSYIIRMEENGMPIETGHVSILH
jgi:PKD repeat protein